MKRKILKQELRVYEKAVPKLFNLILMFDKFMMEVTTKEIYTYDQIVVISKMATDLISLACVYRDNLFFRKINTGKLNEYLQTIGAVVADLDELGRSGDALANNLRDGVKIIEDRDDIPEGFEEKLLALNLQLGSKLFDIRKNYQLMRSTLISLRYLVMQDYTRILMGVDIIRDYTDTQLSLRKIVVKALDIKDFQKVTQHKGGDSDAG